MLQVVFRSIFILFDMFGNFQTLSAHQPFITVLSTMDYGQFIVLFNAAMIIIICVVDYIIVKWRGYRSDYKIGRGLNDLYMHEH